jgi:hypothetical protein
MVNVSDRRRGLVKRPLGSMISTAAISNRHLGIVVLARQLRMRWNLHYPRLHEPVNQKLAHLCQNCSSPIEFS